MSETNVIETPKEILAVAKPAPANLPKFFSYVPKDLTEMMKYGELVAASDFVPKDYKGKPGNCVIGMQFGAELGLPGLQALQNIAVINGKPGVYGDLGKALLYSKGFKIEERDVPEVKKLGVAWCKVTRPDGAVTERTFSIDDAKTAGLWNKQGPWTNYPYRQMAWRAFWFAARDAAADVLKGIWGIEELADYKADAIETSAETNAPREMKPAGEPTPAQPAVDVKAQAEPPANGLSPDQRKNIQAIMGKVKMEPVTLKEHLFNKYGIVDEKRPTAFVTQDKYAELCKWIENPQENLELGQ